MDACIPMSEQDWKTQSALCTLKEADKIQKDPKLMKKVSELATKEMQAMQKLAKDTKQPMKEKPMAKQAKIQPGKQPKVATPKVAKKEIKPTPKKLGKRGK
jgi:hypothetical protein